MFLDLQERNKNGPDESIKYYCLNTKILTG